jgi:hypothetical protein
MQLFRMFCVKDVVKDIELYIMVSYVRVVTNSDRVVVIFSWCTRVPYNMPARTPLGKCAGSVSSPARGPEPK